MSALGSAGIVPVRNDNLPNWYGAVGVNVNIPVFNGFLYNARAKTADLQTEAAKQKIDGCAEQRGARRSNRVAAVAAGVRTVGRDASSCASRPSWR